jgi:hypothetical protein
VYCSSTLQGGVSRMQARDRQKKTENREGTIGPGGIQKADEVIAHSGVTFRLWRLY